MSKHFYQGGKWFCPVELISARESYNIESIWTHANEFRDQIGTDYLVKRRQQNMKKDMWAFLGEALMRKLKRENSYSEIISEAETELLESRIGGHEAAQRIMSAILK